LDVSGTASCFNWYDFVQNSVSISDSQVYNTLGSGYRNLIMPKATLSEIESFLATKRIAVVGVSRNPADFSRLLWGELRKRDYELIPINPFAEEIDGLQSYKSILDVKPVPQAALLMTRPDATEVVSRDCVEAGVEKIWMYRAIGSGAVSEKAVDYCRAAGLEVIDGHCPFMFLPNAGLVHSLHAAIAKFTGGYPQA
jgi:hypothetical protein